MKNFLVFFKDSNGKHRYFKITTDNLKEELPRYMSLYDNYKGISSYDELVTLTEKNPEKVFGIIEVGDHDNYAILNFVETEQSKSDYYPNNLIAKVKMGELFKNFKNKFTNVANMDEAMKLVQI